MCMFTIANVNAQQQATPPMPPPMPVATTPGAPMPTTPVTPGTPAVQMPKQQPGGVTPEDRTEKLITRMTQELTLTPEQQPKVKQLILKREQDKDVNRKKMDALRDENKKIMDSFDVEIKKLLTPDQVTKMDSKPNRMPPHGAPKGNGNEPPVAPSEMPNTPTPVKAPK